jgi:hypothetical protein
VSAETADWDDDVDEMDVHTWFGLSYASYLTINRSLLQSMPDEWQDRFVRCLTELQRHFGYPDEPIYTVYCRDRLGRFIKDPIPHYNRGRTFVPPYEAT